MSYDIITKDRKKINASGTSKLVTLTKELNDLNSNAKEVEVMLVKEKDDKYIIVRLI